MATTDDGIPLWVLQTLDSEGATKAEIAGDLISGVLTNNDNSCLEDNLSDEHRAYLVRWINERITDEMARRRVIKAIHKFFEEAYGDTSSVSGGVEVVIRTEQEIGESETKHTPHYE